MAGPTNNEMMQKDIKGLIPVWSNQLWGRSDVPVLALPSHKWGPVGNQNDSRQSNVRTDN